MLNVALEHNSTTSSLDRRVLKLSAPVALVPWPATTLKSVGCRGLYMSYIKESNLFYNINVVIAESKFTNA